MEKKRKRAKAEGAEGELGGNRWPVVTDPKTGEEREATEREAETFLGHCRWTPLKEREFPFTGEQVRLQCELASRNIGGIFSDYGDHVTMDDAHPNELIYALLESVNERLDNICCGLVAVGDSSIKGDLLRALELMGNSVKQREAERLAGKPKSGDGEDWDWSGAYLHMRSAIQQVCRYGISTDGVDLAPDEQKWRSKVR